MAAMGTGFPRSIEFQPGNPWRVELPRPRETRARELACGPLSPRTQKETITKSWSLISNLERNRSKLRKKALLSLREPYGPPPLLKSDFLPQKQSRSSLLIISVDIINNID
jgi:hypothetical protein